MISLSRNKAYVLEYINDLYKKKRKKQAGAELGQAQPQLGFWELISFSFKVEN